MVTKAKFTRKGKKNSFNRRYFGKPNGVIQERFELAGKKRRGAASIGDKPVEKA